MKRIKPLITVLLLIGILLVAAGCTDASEEETNAEASSSEQNIRSVLEKIFTGPDEEQEQLIAPEDVDAEKAGQKFSEYHDQYFKPYLAEDFFENFVNTNESLYFLQPAHPDYQLEAKEFSIEEKEDTEDAYHFTVNVAYTNTETEESETMEVDGSAYTNEQGKLTSIRYINEEEFREALEE